MPAHSPSATAPDSFLTVAAIGLVAYVSADVAHHVVGHGGACIVSGGYIQLLSSVFAQCSCKNAFVDLAGPLANLLVGAGALAAGQVGRWPAPATRLFLALTAAFNLLYFSGQLTFDAATSTDDWAWALRYYLVPDFLRYALVAVGAFTYWLTLRWVIQQLAPFAQPRTRANALVWCAWTSAGLIAGITAALDHPAGRAIVYHALPQALLLPLGLLFVPALAARQAMGRAPAEPLVFSIRWVICAAVVGAGSILVLGPGVGSAR